MLRRKSIAPRATVEPLESRQLLTVISGFAETQIASGINRATQMDFAPDGRLFVSQQDGKLRVIKNGTLLGTSFLTVPVINTGESGLIGVTFDPNFASNKYVYVYYTRPDGSAFRNRVSRFTANGDVAVSGSEKVLFEGDLLGPGTWHQAGGLEFGRDGKLYISMGDNQKGAPAQSLSSVLGKILRINSDGTIPTDNPFYNSTSGKYRAIWAYGFRNPYTFDVQPGTGRIMVGDVGAAKTEELNELTKGANYGWPNVEGPTTNTAYKNPFYSYNHAGGETDDSAITGVAFYNPPSASFPSSYVGDVFFGDYGTGNIKRIDLSTKQVSSFVTNVIGVTDVDIAADGSLYYLNRASGKVFRVRSTTSVGPSIVEQPQSQTVSAGQSVTFSVTANGSNLTYQWKKNGVNITGATSASYTINSAAIADNGAKYRVAVTSGTTSVTSNEATLTVINNNAPTATITSPDVSFKWVGGGSVSYGGTGTDAEDGTLAASAFTWKVDLHHDTHVHPFIPAYSGVKSNSFNIPDDSHDGETNIWYRITLTVKDSKGATSTTFKDVFPQKVQLSLATNPAGLKLELDSAETATPYQSPAIVGFKRTLNAPATQTLNGVLYEFTGWNDGGARSHSIITPSTNVTYTATYQVSTQQVNDIRAAADAYVRDGSYAGTNFGTAADLQVKNDGVGWNRWSYLTFNLAGVQDTVGSAKLKLNARLDSTLAASVPVTIYPAASTFSETGLTWNNKPAAGTTALASFNVAGTTAKAYEVDLTTYLKQQKAAGATSVTLVIKAGAAKSTVLIASDEAAANRPTLTVTSSGGTGGGDPDPEPGQPITLRSNQDTYVRDGSSETTPFGASTELQVKKHSAVGYSRETYLLFDLSTVSTVASAKLRLYGRLTEASTVSSGVFVGATAQWNEQTLTWQTRISTTSNTTPSATATLSGAVSKWYEWDVTSLLQQQKAAGASAVTLVIRNLTQTDATTIFASDEASANRPELVVA